MCSRSYVIISSVATTTVDPSMVRVSSRMEGGGGGGGGEGGLPLDLVGVAVSMVQRQTSGYRDHIST